MQIGDTPRGEPVDHLGPVLTEKKYPIHRRDVHAAQFAVSGVTRCERCHTSDSWKAARFDHNRDASYALDGAHARVACSGCHPTEQREGRRVVRYKPLACGCRDCHMSGRTP